MLKVNEQPRVDDSIEIGVLKLLRKAYDPIASVQIIPKNAFDTRYQTQPA